MPEAWQFREMQRQEFIEEMMGRIYEEEEQSQNPIFLFSLGEAILGYLRCLREDELIKSPKLITPTEETCLFGTELLPEIRSFSRVPAEENILLAELLGQVIKAATQPFVTKMGEAELQSAEAVYGAPATAEVPFPE